LKWKGPIHRGSDFAPQKIYSKQKTSQAIDKECPYSIGILGNKTGSLLTHQFIGKCKNAHNGSLTLICKKMKWTKIYECFCLLFITCLLLSASCNKSSMTTSSLTGTGGGGGSLAVSGIQPTSGPYTTAVTITGTGFSATPASDSVLFNGVYTAVTSATSTQLMVQVPARAGTGTVSVKVSGSVAIGPVFSFQYTSSQTVFAGNGNINDVNGQGTAASFFRPTSIAMDQSGNLLVAEAGGAVRTVSSTALVGNFPQTFTPGYNATGSMQLYLQQFLTLSLDNTNHLLFVADATSNQISVFNSQSPFLEATIIEQNIDPNSNAKLSAYLNPFGLFTQAGVLYVSNYGNSLLQSITQAGVQNLKVSGGLLNQPCGLAVDASQNIYVANEGNNNIVKITPSGTATVFAGSSSGVRGTADGTGTAAGFFGPTNVVIDGQGNLYVADSYNQKIRLITQAGVVSTFPYQYSLASGLAVDSSGSTLYIADANSCVIFKMSIN
jgi:serine/threonine protein kinase, bacterial